MMPSDSDNFFATGKQIEDYLIGDLICRGEHTLTWKAIQVSVQREVVVHSLCESFEHDAEMVELFFSDVRAKASVEHPLVGSVLEAVNASGHCFYACEKLQGESLETHHNEGLSISPLHVARIIRGLSDVYKYYESKSVATVPLTAHDLFLDKRFHCRMVNMVVCGEIDPAVFTHDKQMLGMLFHDLLDPNQPGATRVGSLLDYMADVNREEPLTWDQIHSLSDEVERQLAEPKKPVQIQSETMSMKPANSKAFISKMIIALTIVLTVVGLAYYVINRKSNQKEKITTQFVHIPAGEYPGPDGGVVKTPEFWIDSHEVTIGEYAKFLRVIDKLEGSSKSAFQHDDQPKSKTSNVPDDWDELYSAAQSGGEWNGYKIDLNSPVVGVDWWDAYAYAQWKERRLPTREEWYISGSSVEDLTKVKGVASYVPVNESKKFSNGIYGLAGNVSEWTRKRSLDPADPTKPPRYVICGASYLKSKYGALYREWVDDRNLRRKDLGFRTLSYSEKKQGE